MQIVQSIADCRRKNAKNVTSTYLLSLRASFLLKYYQFFPIDRLKTQRQAAMKIPLLLCLVTGFGLAQIPALVFHARPSAPQPSLVDANAAAGPAQLFSQYDVPLPETVSVAAVDIGPQDALSTSDASPITDTSSVVASASTLTPAPADIAGNVSQGVAQMNAAMKTAPVAMSRMTDSVAKNGIIAALAYDDPAVKEQTNKLGAQIGDSLRNFSEAIGKDMQRSVRESGIQQQSVSAR